MKLSEFKEALRDTENVEFRLENGEKVPRHFHVTEVGEIQKRFIDCGGLVREEKAINFQLWSADDLTHRLQAGKLLDIIRISEEKLGISDGEIEVEYQRDTIGKFGLEFSEGQFLLTSKQTACLAEDACGVPAKEKPAMEIIASKASVCTPGSGCC